MSRQPVLILMLLQQAWTSPDIESAAAEIVGLHCAGGLSSKCHPDSTSDTLHEQQTGYAGQAIQGWIARSMQCCSHVVRGMT